MQPSAFESLGASRSGVARKAEYTGDSREARPTEAINSERTMPEGSRCSLFIPVAQSGRRHVWCPPR